MYLDDELWQVLHEQAERARTTISELVRQATRERYLGNLDQRKAAMQAFVGIRKNRTEFRDAVGYVRRLRQGSRIERLGES